MNILIAPFSVIPFVYVWHNQDTLHLYLGFLFSWTQYFILSSVLVQTKPLFLLKLGLGFKGTLQDS